MADFSAEVILAGYRLVGHAVRPFVPAILSRRAARGREDMSRAAERYGIASRARPAGRLVWVHAASVGETNAVLPLIARLTGAGFGVLLTTATLTSAGIAARRLPPGAAHQFAPFDIGPFIARFLAHWRPDLAIFVESELWPNMIGQAAASMPVVIVNARLSERSYRAWRRCRPAARRLLSDVTLCLAQSARDGERFAALGLGEVDVTGNLKFDAPAPDCDADALAEFRALVGDRPVWIAASTHDGEETAVAAAHARLAERFPDVLTIIAPRHPQRGDEVRATLAARGLAIAQRSRGEAVAPDTDIYLADTVGELGLFYRAAPVAFLGGSLIEHGGQNPIEPVRIGAAVVHGPYVHNFDEVYALLDREAGLPVVENAAGLAEAVGRWFATPDEARRVAGAAAAALERDSGALEATLAALQPFLTRLRDA